jgi:hypothetical protein
MLTHETPELLRTQLQVLRVEHRDLDAAITRLSHDTQPDELLLRRLKKRKLILKDRIIQLEQLLEPDEPA